MEGTMRGFKGTDLNLSASDAALAKRIGEQFRAALAEDRLIRAGLIPEPFTPEEVART
jgi:hypothetical protein